MVTVRKLSREIAQSYQNRSKLLDVVSYFAKIGLVTVGAAVATGAQFVAWPDNTGPSISQIVGLIASVVTGIGGLIVIMSDSDTSKEMALAEKSVMKAQEVLYDNTYTDMLERNVISNASYVQAQEMMIGLISEQIGFIVGDDTKIPQQILRIVGRELSVACGFMQQDLWTIGVQKAIVNEDGEKILRPVASKRAVECDLDRSRDWPIEAGATGVAFRSQKLVLIEDMSDPNIHAALGMRNSADDDDTYRSIAAAPILLNPDEQPWGVVIATSNVVNHFGPSPLQSSNDEPVKQFASLLSLALKVRDLNSRCPDSVPEQPQTG